MTTLAMLQFYQTYWYNINNTAIKMRVHELTNIFVPQTEIVFTYFNIYIFRILEMKML